jgi:AraC-like DNA-binding protein|tara:strand:- start:300 stop:770 length:471 start_codon:yes stop_codon:yes gene_type:complete
VKNNKRGNSMIYSKYSLKGFIVSLYSRLNIFDANTTSFLPGINIDKQEALESNKRLELLIFKVIEINYSDHKFNVSSLSEHLGISTRHLQRKCFEIYNLSPKKVILNYRLEKAVNLLHEKKLVKVIAYSTGFTSDSYFCQCFKKQFKQSPSNYIKH